MSDLRARIEGLPGDAQEREEQAYELEHTNKGEKDAITKVFNAIGSVLLPSAASRRRTIATQPPACAMNCVSWKAKTNETQAFPSPNGPGKKPLSA
ncbi:MAG TPA: hypothetical protein VF749_05035 [Candidatus Acidoferrum sp.]